MQYICLFFFAMCGSIVAQDQLISISTISNKTILLRFDEGEKDLTDFKEYYFYDAPNETYYGEINEAEVLQVSNFSIVSTDDVNYTTPQTPQATYFKAKEQKGLFEYWVYIEFPSVMQSGATYTINVSNINANQASYTITIDPFAVISESIHVNQIGMIPSATKKYAYVSQWLGKNNSQISNFEDFSSMEGVSCHVVRISDNEIIYTGDGEQGLGFRFDDDATTGFNGGLANTYWTRSGVWEFNFSEVGTAIAVHENEEYKIVIEGIGSSSPFKISNKSYDGVVQLLSQGMYHQRSGIDRDVPYSNLPKPVDHVPGVDGFEITYSNYRRLDNVNADEESFVALPAQATNLINPTNPAPWMTSPDNLPWGSGGHFDAGDHDIYTEHLMVPLYLTFSYLMAPQGYYDGQFNIPENNNTLPDVLDEARWTLDFFRRTKGPTGGICGGKETTGYYNPSWNNGSGESSTEQMWYVYREDPAASFLYAAAAAQFALALQENGDTTNESQLYIDDAIAAYNWATQNIEIGDVDKLISGFPVNGKFPDLQLMAAAMLYSVTGIQEYIDFYINNSQVTNVNSDLYVFQEYDNQFATYAYALIPKDKWTSFNTAALTLQNTQQQAIINWAYAWGLNDQENNPFRHISSQFNPPLGGNTSSTPEVFDQLMAYHLNGDVSILNNILASIDLNLGGNPNNWVYITGAETIGAAQNSSDPLHIDNWQYGGDNIPGLPLYGLSSASFYYFQSSPPAEEWPHFECNSNARIYLGHSEFTVHQNSAPALATYGYLNGILNDEVLNVFDQEITPSNNWIAYPNPSNGNEISLENKRSTFKTPVIEVYDQLGRKITPKIVSENDKIRLSLQGNPKGLYMLRIFENSQPQIIKIVYQ